MVWARGFVRIFIIVGVMAGILFTAAGRMDWLAAWFLTILYILFLLIVMVWGFRNAPELMRERGSVASNVKSWDKIIIRLYSLLVTGLFVIAGLDSGRFYWSSVPIIVQIFAWFGLLITVVVVWRTMVANTYLSSMGRIQDDRGHQVVTTGPYRFVRHPMYVGVIICMFSIPLILNSLWALIPGILIAILFVIRTRLEDKTLQSELDGYLDYTRKVKYRLIPGVW